jgi:PilZ domain
MNKRPIALTILSWFLVGVALSFPIQIMILFEHTEFNEIGEVFSKLTWLNILVMSIALTNAGLAYYAHPWLKQMSLIGFGVVTLNNIWVGYTGLNYSMTTSILSLLGYMGVHSMMLLPSVKTLLSSQTHRWWLTPQRYTLLLPIEVHPWKGQHFSTSTFDISENGAYMISDPSQGAWKQLNYSEPLKPGAELNIRFRIGTLNTIRCAAKVVRVGQANGKYPEGMGIQFKGLSRYQKQRIKSWLADMALDQQQQQQAA